MKREICITIDADVLEHVDEKRGELINRSRMIVHLVKLGIEAEQHAATRNTQAASN